MALVACAPARGEDVDARRVRQDADRAVVAGGAAGRLAGVVVSHELVAYASMFASPDARDGSPALAPEAGVRLVTLAVEMIEANRRGHDEPARPTSDGLSFQAQHPRDRSAAFVVGLPPVRF